MEIIQSYPQDSETYERRLEKFLLNTKPGKIWSFVLAASEIWTEYLRT
jgi:hypothetical protein